MNLFYRIILKTNVICRDIHDNAYIEICKARGMKVGKNVILIETPAFGSEPYLIEISDCTKITAGCTFINHDGAMYVIRNMEKYKDARNFGRIKLGSNCFAGNNCTFLPGSQMGNNCILGTGSVLNTSMPDNSVYTGVPAKFICTIEEYGNKALANNVMYPRELEPHRSKLDTYIKEHLPHNYKHIKNK
ncbi:Putative acetyltransferase [Chryseobacterium aquaeductus]|uniref:Acetyltransferase n=1 Tax=Chryseobacterium aquaeductus TaxID=2675056 RepID=A0A9N8QRL6_9FLAO|nr:acyltransferase [Chryseobacterium aquaeductus]CAA7330505.1 Putative acetyltransferase [Chryseobacterium potabilaquae]CAD7804107.1 Putative acetyltransferase [Chryseobacterium aquaeductus]